MQARVHILVFTVVTVTLLELRSSSAAPQQNLRPRPRDQFAQQQEQRPFTQPQQQQQSQAPYRESNRVRQDPIPIVRFENVNDGDGRYNFFYETGNGITHEESGYLANPGTDNEAQTVQGYYQYYGDDGRLFKTVYKADDHGFQPEGDHLPTPPPIPPEIQKSLAIIYAAAAKQQKRAIEQNSHYNDDRNRYYY